MQHTVRLILATNIEFEDDSGHRLALLLAPLTVLAFWLPAWLFSLPAQLQVIQERFDLSLFIITTIAKEIILCSNNNLKATTITPPLG